MPTKDAEIHHYLAMDRPYDCAGSFRMEAAGVCLFRELRGRNTRVGLLLIALVNLLIPEWMNPLEAETARRLGAAG